EIATTDPEYFKWTQWIFLKLYNSWFNPKTKKAEPIETFRKIIERIVQDAVANKAQPEMAREHYDLLWWAQQRLSEGNDPQLVIRHFFDLHRLAYVQNAPVWWCDELGTVLANEEVVDGKSEVGGFPVIRKPMRQWMLRITAYAERLIQDLDTIDWSSSLRE